MPRVLRTALRILVLALVLPLSLSSALPYFARVLAPETAHVCHCKAGGAHLTCPVCTPRLKAEVGSDAVAGETIRGQCGDEDKALGAFLETGVLAPIFSVGLAPSERASFSPRREWPIEDLTLAPPKPPPRAART
jgi:hypothetical protein